MRETIRLPVKLNEPEVAERADELARTIAKRDSVEALAKDESRRAKDEVKEMDERIGDLAGIVRDKVESRPVDTRWEPELERRLYRRVRLDTLEVVESRPMTTTELEEESQARLPFADASPADDDAPGAAEPPRRGRKSGTA